MPPTTGTGEAGREPARPHAPPLVGRDRELAQARDALATPGALVLVSGEAGVGKSRLVAEVLATLPPAAGAALVVRGLPPEDAYAFGALVDGIRRLTRTAGGAAPWTTSGGRPPSGVLRSLFVDWADDLPPAPPPADDPAETRLRLRAALVDLVTRLAPPAVVLEDAHWLDTATLDWAVELRRSPDAPPVIAAARSDDPRPAEALVRLAGRRDDGPRPVRLDLRPLDRTEVGELVTRWLGGGTLVSAEFADFLWEHTDGLPLAVEESIALLRDRHDIVERDGRWLRRRVAALGVPPTLRDSVLERVERLDADVRAVLLAAAVLAVPETADHLAAVADLDPDRCADALAAATASGLLRETQPGTYVFRHSLDARAVADAADPAALRAAHRRAGPVLAADDPSAAVRLARHAWEAGDHAAWRRHTADVAGLAVAAGDHAAAVETWTSVLERLPAADDPRPVIRALDAARGPSAEVPESRRAARAVAEVLEADRVPADALAETWLVLGRFLWVSEQEEAACEAWETAATTPCDDPDITTRAMLNLSPPLVRAWPVERHQAWLRRAAEQVERGVSPAVRQTFLRQRATSLLLLGDPDGWAEAEQRWARPSTDAGDLADLGDVWASTLTMNLVAASLPWGSLDVSRRLLATATEQAADSRHRVVRGLLALRAIDIACHAGDFAEARRLHTLADHDPALSLDPATARRGRAVLDVLAGPDADLPLLVRIDDEVSADHAVTPDSFDVPALLVRVALALGDLDTAIAHGSRALDLAADRGCWFWATDVLVPHLDALVAAGRPTRAREVLDLAARALARVEAPAPSAALAEGRAALAAAAGRHREAADEAARAASLRRAGGCLHRALLADERELAARVALVTSEEQVRELRRRLVAVAGEHDDLGATWDAARVRGVAARLPGPAEGVAELSPRERDVLRLVAAGLTNREVGERLFISPKTVGLHLGNAMRKLGVHTRTAAARCAADAGLLEDA